MGNFTKVELSEKGDLFIDFGDQEKLIIEAQENLLEHLVAEIKDGILDIKKLPPNVTLDTDEPIRYYLTVKELESLTVKNSGDVEVAELKGDRVLVRITGSGSVHIEALYANLLDVELTSSGNLTIDQGFVEGQKIQLSSSGEYNGGKVESQQTAIRVSSSGSASVYATDRLEADLSSSGSVYYLGSPTITMIDSSSTGRVLKAP